MELLKIDNLSKEYKGGTKALSNISFSINKGEFISITFIPVSNISGSTDWSLKLGAGL